MSIADVWRTTDRTVEKWFRREYEEHKQVSDGLLRNLYFAHADNPPDAASAQAIQGLRSRLGPPPYPQHSKPPRQPIESPVRRVTYVNRRGKPTIGEIQEQEAARAGITVAELLSPSKRHVYLKPRDRAIWLACNETGLSLPQIGRRFGGRDHSTIIAARNRFQARLDAGEVTV